MGSSDCYDVFSSDIFGFVTSTDSGGGLGNWLFKPCPILISQIAVDGICLLSFAALVLASCLIKRKKQRGRRVFAVLHGLVWALFTSFLRSVIGDVFHGFTPNLPEIFFILRIVKQILTDIPDTTLLYVVYAVIDNRLRALSQIKYGRLILAHQIISSAMILFGFGDTALFAYAQSQVIGVGATSNSTRYAYYYNITHLSYTCVYFVVTLEILLTAILVFRGSRLPQTTHNASFDIITTNNISGHGIPHVESAQKSGSIPKYLVTMIAPFLVLRAATTFAFAILYVYLAHKEEAYTGIIVGVLIGFPIVIICTGLVKTGRQSDWTQEDKSGPMMSSSLQNRGVNFVGSGPSYNGPSFLDLCS